jgi:hypothetical protein
MGRWTVSAFVPGRFMIAIAFCSSSGTCDAAETGERARSVVLRRRKGGFIDILVVRWSYVCSMALGERSGMQSERLANVEQSWVVCAYSTVSNG